MAPKKRAMRDALCALDGEDSDSSEEEEQAKPSEEETAQAQKKIRLEALERAGYSSGPSLLHIPKQPDDDADAPSGWGTGKGQSVLDHSPTAEVHTDHMRFWLALSAVATVLSLKLQLPVLVGVASLVAHASTRFSQHF